MAHLCSRTDGARGPPRARANKIRLLNPEHKHNEIEPQGLGFTSQGGNLATSDN